jgi:hypothetical protein
MQAGFKITVLTKKPTWIQGQLITPVFISGFFKLSGPFEDKVRLILIVFLQIKNRKASSD